MGFRLRKSKKLGPVRVNLSKSGIGYSVGTTGVRFTKKADGGTRSTYSIPGTGISYVSESGKKSTKRKAAPKQRTTQRNNTTSPSGNPQPPKKKNHTVLWVIAALLALAVIGSFGSPKSDDTDKSAAVSSTSEITRTTVPEISSTSTSAEKLTLTTEETPTPTEKPTPTTEMTPTPPPEIEATSVSITFPTEILMVGERGELAANISPLDVTNTQINWTTNNPEVLSIYEDGSFAALSGGTAEITATASNGVSDSREITVDGSKREMTVKVTNKRDNYDVNIGDEWSYIYNVNGASISNPYLISVGDTITVSARITEDDENPDVGEGTYSYTVSEDDLAKGFWIELDMYVEENGGRNAGQSAHFIVRFEFS